MREAKPLRVHIHEVENVLFGETLLGLSPISFEGLGGGGTSRAAIGCDSTSRAAIGCDGSGCGNDIGGSVRASGCRGAT